MAIKPQHTLIKEDFETALVTLRLSVSEVARETEIPRHVVSHFRNYGDGMKPEQVAKLRDWLEDKGIEFTDHEETPAEPQPASGEQSITLPRILSDDGLTQRTALLCRHFFIDERINDGQIGEAGERILESFNQAKELLGVKLETRLLGGYDEKTETRMRELWGHLARIGLVCLHMQGRVLVDQARFVMPIEDDEPDTLGDLLFATYREALAGLHQTAPAEEVEAEDQEEVAA